MLELKGNLRVNDQSWHFVANEKDQRGKMSTTQFESFIRNTLKILTHVSCFKPSARSSQSHASPQNLPEVGIFSESHPPNARSKNRGGVEFTATWRNIIQSLSLCLQKIYSNPRYVFFWRWKCMPHNYINSMSLNYGKQMNRKKTGSKCTEK